MSPSLPRHKNCTANAVFCIFNRTPVEPGVIHFLTKEPNMKKMFWFCLPLTLAACNNTAKDSVAKADSANEAKADSTGSDSSNRANKPSLGVSESTADFLVSVAD